MDFFAVRPGFVSRDTVGEILTVTVAFVMILETTVTVEGRPALSIVIAAPISAVLTVSVALMESMNA